MRTVAPVLPVLLACVLAASPLAGQLGTSVDPYAEGRLEVTTTSPEAAMHVIAGLDEQANRHFPAALEHFERALALDPAQPLARGGAAIREPGVSGAERVRRIEQAIASAPGASAPELAWLLAWREERQGRADNARALREAAVAMAPGDPALAYEHAVREPDVHDRIAALRRVLERFPAYAPAHNILAYLLYRTGDKPGGVRHVREYLRLLPDHPNALDSYAELMAWEGDLDAAERAYRRAIELAPDYAQANAGLREVFLLRGQYDDARALIREAMAETADAGDRHWYEYDIALTHLFEGDAAEASRQMAQLGERTAAASAGTARWDSWSAAVLAAHAGNRAAADRYMQAAADLPGDAGPAPVLIRAAAAPDDVATLRAAVSELEQASQDPAMAHRWADDLRFARALLAIGENDLERARAQADEIRSVQRQQLARAFLAEALKRAGRTQDARALGQEILSYPWFGIEGVLARVKAQAI